MEYSKKQLILSLYDQHIISKDYMLKQVLGYDILKDRKFKLIKIIKKINN